jgi:hypothetical protein
MQMRFLLALAAVLLVAGPGLAADYPPLKPGMWESHIQRDDAKGAPMPTSQMCIDASMVKEMMSMGQNMAKSMCSKMDSHFSGNKHYAESVCKFGTSTMKANSVTTFVSDSAYHTEVHATYDPPFMGKNESNTVVEAKWTGPCPAGMQPGDMTGPGGMKMNIRQLQGGK